MERTAPGHTRGASPGPGHTPGCARTRTPAPARRGRSPRQPRAVRGVRGTARQPRAPPAPQLRPSVSAAPPGGAARRCPFKAAQPRAHSSGRVTVPGSGWRHPAIPPAVHPAAAGRAPGNKGGIKIEGREEE
ncbi:atrophin-1-like [Poecile atricapillus]|uniref:atrophin-1-like n=1 Tax=Poecile atricapillus TaxID=48891 RepID=UPI0027391659|nr:atrophin-1-like [Poecile atricapillus]XP_058691948.1 atrophin-1-like [Poecile atricapillus]XP_058691949.1 atrophin-1-like [Poecile atricapillus]